MREALKLALEALEDIRDDCSGCEFEWNNDYPLQAKAHAAIKEALAQPEQEPLAWAEFDGEGGYHFRAYEDNEDYAEQWDKRNPNHVGWVKPLYTTPPQRKPLTDRQKLNLVTNWFAEDWAIKKALGLLHDYDIEAAHGIKE